MSKQSSERIAEELAQAQDRYKRAVQQAEELREKQVVVDLESDLGQLVLTAYGELVAVRLNTEELRYANGRSLAEAIKRALEQGEEQARQLREPEEPKGWI
ncbi:hypothetical protein [Saccharopolyspora spinosa]|uniref:DNA-binding protein YbaB n=1 Tax=Saccharopolyspora spinosa TaxID=60894 RepID=A0A2N3Y7U2_SACSN|nr:hypothetical protein [Saccharopolyspora spinosa]PKW18933.1 hypothetical protein A8926_7072 [Saccharopolyspora spinosa]